MPARARAVGVALASALLSPGLVGCDGATAPDEPRTQRPSAADRSSDAAPSSSASPQEQGPATTMTPAPGPLDDLPEHPSLRGAEPLAEQLMTVEAVIADASSRPADVRRAGEFEQLAARMLARAPDAFAESVLARLGPAVRAKTRAH